MMWLQQKWYESRLHPLLYLLAPLSLLFWLLTNLRRSLYKFRLLPRYRSDRPVIVVGNISVGGTGKTPMTLALVNFLKAEGYQPGIVSRGYGANTQFPHVVNDDDRAVTVGDEPLLMKHNSGCPVVIAPKRAEAVRALIADNPQVDVIISDDGLQHYAMARDIELILIDAERGVGNGWLLPAGPLREGPWRLKGAEWVISLYAQHPFARFVCDVEAGDWHRVSDGSRVDTPSEKAYAIAGIGNPHRFFHSLEQQEMALIDCVSFPDHHQFSTEDFAEFGQNPVLMTEKDAAKCREFARDNWYYQPISANLPDELTAGLAKRLRKLVN